MEMIFHSHANKTHFHKKGCALGFILKVRVFGSGKWPIRGKWPIIFLELNFKDCIEVQEKKQKVVVVCFCLPENVKLGSFMQ